MRNKLIRRSLADRIFDSVNIFILGLIGLTAILPFLYVISGSFSSDIELSTRSFFLIPLHPNTGAYEFIFSTNRVVRSLLNSTQITVVGTAINLFFTVTMAYALSKPYLWGRKLIMKAVIFSMLFSGGMIPTYIVVRNLHLINSYWSLWLPAAISAFNLIIIKNFFEQLPPGLEESARIDGASDLVILLKIVMPLSMPVLATFALFYAVGHWNAFFGALIYINKTDKWPLQVVLRNMVMLSSGMAQDATLLDPEFSPPPDQAVKMAVIVVATIPILMVYPFLQKHFVKGVLLGSIK